MEYWKLKIAKQQAKVALKEFEKPLICGSVIMPSIKELEAGLEQEIMEMYEKQKQPKKPKTEQHSLEIMILQLKLMGEELKNITMNPENMVAIIEAKSELTRAERKIQKVIDNT